MKKNVTVQDADIAIGNEFTGKVVRRVPHSMSRRASALSGAVRLSCASPRADERHPSGAFPTAATPALEGGEGFGGARDARVVKPRARRRAHVARKHIPDVPAEPTTRPRARGDFRRRRTRRPRAPWTPPRASTSSSLRTLFLPTPARFRSFFTPPPSPHPPGIPQKRVQDYGCFVDFGAKSDGLVHISELTNGFVENVSDVVSENQEVTVWIKSIDTEKGRISLTMKPPHGGGARGH